MNRTIVFCLFSLAVFSACVMYGAGPAKPALKQPVHALEIERTKAEPNGIQRFAQLPLYFEKNLGQTDSSVNFIARGAGYQMWLAANQAILRLPGKGTTTQPSSPLQWLLKLRHRDELPEEERDAPQAVEVRMKMLGSNEAAMLDGLERLPGISNYFIGNDPSKWRTHVPHYAKLRVREVYAGIDLVYYGNSRKLEYDFIVRPGADVNAIKLAYEGVDRLRVDEGGDLVLRLAGGDLIQRKPKVYQEIGGRKVEIAAGYRITADGVTFALANFDRNKPLVIDPVLEYASYIGGGLTESGYALAIDQQRNAYVGGATPSTDLRKNANIPGYQTSRRNAFSGGNSLPCFERNPNCDAFIVKLNAQGTGVVYATYIGGADFDFGRDLSVDAAGNAFLVGETISGTQGGTLFPTSGSGARTSPQGAEGFLVQLNSSGTGLVYSTYVGGSGNEGASSVKIGINSVYVLGSSSNTTSATFNNITPVRPYNPQNRNEGFVAKYSRSTPTMQALTFVGTEYDDFAWNLALDAQENVYIVEFYEFLFQGQATDYDCSAIKLNTNLNLLWGKEVLETVDDDIANGIAISPNGSEVFVVGYTTSNSTGGSNTYGRNGNGGDAFLAILNSSNGTMTNLGLFGGDGQDIALSVAVDQYRTAYVAGTSNSNNFPVTFGGTQVINAGGFDNFIFRAKPLPGSASGFGGFGLLFASYFGGPAIPGFGTSGNFDEVATQVRIDIEGNVYFAGIVHSPSASQSVFPSSSTQSIYPYSGNGDAYVAKLAIADLSTTLSCWWRYENNVYNRYCDYVIRHNGGAEAQNVRGGVSREVSGAPPISCVSGCNAGSKLFSSARLAAGQSATARFRQSYTVPPSANSVRTLELQPRQAGGGGGTGGDYTDGSDNDRKGDDDPTKRDDQTPPQNCSSSFAPTTLNFTGSASTLSSAVASPADCAWSLLDKPDFVTVNIVGGEMMKGPGSISVTVTANPGGARSGLVRVTSLSTPGRINTLQVEQAPGSCSQPITVGQTITSSLTSNCLMDLRPGSYRGSYQFNGTAGQRISISAGSSAFNTYIYLRSSTGAVLAEDDDSGSNRNSRIPASGFFTLPATAAYTIDVSSYGPAQFGLYTVQLLADVPPPTGLRFVPMTPCRILETRPQYAGTRWSGQFGPPILSAGATRTIPVTSSPNCVVPSNAKAFVFNVTLDTQEAFSGPVDFVTIWPSDEPRPNFYTARTTTGGYIANNAIVKASANGSVNVYASNNVHLLLDLNGYFTDTPNAGLLYYPVNPCRAVDTRSVYSTLPPPYGRQRFNAQERRTFRLPGSPGCQIPAAAAYSLQMTIVPGLEADGPRVDFLTAWPSGQGRPEISNMNAYFGYVAANSGIIAASADGSIDVYANNATNVIIDVNGYFAPDDGTGRGLFYHTVPQCRLMNTQDPIFFGAFGPPALTRDVPRVVRIPGGGCPNFPAAAQAWALNAWVTPGGISMPYLSLWPAGTAWPGVSQLNAFQGQTIANSAIVPVNSNAEINVLVNNTTNVALEAAGYFSRP